jgi:hypothetical protein
MLWRHHFVRAATRQGRKPVLPPSVEQEILWYCQHRYRFGRPVKWNQLGVAGGHVEHVTARAAEGVSPKALVATYSDMTKRSGQAKKAVTPSTMSALGV